MNPCITLLLHNIRSTYNVGAILRTAEGLGAAGVAYSGYTPAYHDPALLPHLRAKLDRQIAKSALGAEQLVLQERITNLPAWLAGKRTAGYLLLGLENNLAPPELDRQIVLGADLPTFMPSAPTAGAAAPLTPIPRPLILLLGEEVHGIPPEIRPLVDYFLEIPMCGQKESFNVSVATAIALWELTRSAATSETNL